MNSHRAALLPSGVMSVINRRGRGATGSKLLSSVGNPAFRARLLLSSHKGAGRGRPAAAGETPALLGDVRPLTAARGASDGRLRREQEAVVTPGVTRREKLITDLLSGRADANFDFDDLRGILLGFGFEERTRGSHHVFRRSGIEERLNLQRDGRNAKPYQVKQVRGVVLKYRLAGDEE